MKIGAHERPEHERPGDPQRGGGGRRPSRREEEALFPLEETPEGEERERKEEGEEEKEEGRRREREEKALARLSKKEMQRRQLQVLRSRIRLKAAETVVEGEVEAGILLALAAGVLGLPSSPAWRPPSPGGGRPPWPRPALSLSPAPAPGAQGSRPGGGAGPFMDPLEKAVAAGQAALVLEVSKAALGPLFLASLVPVAF